MIKKHVEIAAQAYYAVRPLHFKFDGVKAEPVGWAEMKKSKDDPVRQETLRAHMAAIEAALEAYLKSTET